jgi:pimeloyl-ACP methyl ester carboxylesterase
MAGPEYLITAEGRRIAYRATDGQGPCVVFMGGYKSDMDGSKAVHLEAWARSTGRRFVRFDYSGHGLSDGAFEDGCIGDWAADALAVLTALADGPPVIVGSSMGGWIALLCAKALPRVHGLVTIAAAPDFTEDAFWDGFSDAQRDKVMTTGRLELPSDYGEPYIVTRRLIEDGRTRLVLRSPLALPFPVRSLIGTADTSVSTGTALRLLEHADSPDMQLRIVKDADHSFSTPRCLRLIEEAIADVSRPAADPAPS